MYDISNCFNPEEYMEESFKSTIGNFDYIQNYADEVRKEYSNKENLVTYNGYNEYRIKDTNGEPVALFHFDKDFTEVIDSDTLKNLKMYVNLTPENRCNITVFHHTDLDGDSSGSLINQLIRFNNQTSIRFIRYNYNGTFISDEIERMVENPTYEKKKNIAFVLDLSLKNNQLEEILKYYDKVVWIDHHITSLYQNPISLCNQYNNFTYILDTRECGCWLTYAWLYNSIKAVNSKDTVDSVLEMLENFDMAQEQYKLDASANEALEVYKSKAPLVGLISVYDLKQDVKYPQAYQPALWLNQWYNDIKTLEPYCNTWQNIWRGNYYYDDEDNKPFITPDVEEILTNGYKLYTLFQLKMRALRAADPVYEYKVNDKNTKLEFHCLNGFGFSQRFEENREDIKIIARFIDNRSKLSFSFYTDNEEIKELVPLGKLSNKYFNGGGHPGAAGGTVPVEVMTETFEKIISAGSLPQPDNKYRLKDVDFNFSDLQELESIIGITNFTGSTDEVRFDDIMDIYFRLFVALIVYEYKLAKR